MRSFTLIQWILIFTIFLGIILRLIGLGNEYLFDDEQPSMIAEMKFHRQSFYDGAMYFQEHPPLGKWLLGIPSAFIDANYVPLNYLTPNLFIWKHITYESLGKNYYLIRLLNALIGILAILFVYLIASKAFDKKSALWSATIFALSADFILYSRHDNLLKMPVVTFLLGTLYFYTKYLESKDNFKFIYLVSTLIFFSFSIGSRNYDPLFIIPTLLIGQFIINKGKKNLIENIIFVLLLAFCFYIVLYYFYPLEAKEFAQYHLEVKSPLKLIGFGMPGIFINSILRNSYAYSLVFIFFLILIFKKDFIKAILNRNSILPIIFLIVSFLGISFTQKRFGYGASYNIAFFSAFHLLSGKVIEYLSNKKKIFTYIFILTLAISSFIYLMSFPYGLWDYSNLGSKYPTYNKGFDKVMVDNVLSELSKYGNPPLITDSLNLLIFYNGEKYPLPINHINYCNSELIESISKKDYFLFIKSIDLNNEFNLNFLCPMFINNIKLETVKVFQITEEGFQPTLYKIIM